MTRLVINFMNIIIQLDEAWYKNDFIASINSLFVEASIVPKPIFVIRKKVDKNIIKIIDAENFVKVDSLEEAKKIVDDKVMIMMYPILFFKNWDIRMNNAVKKLGNKYNYVPSFVNHFGEQLSILDKVYPDNMLFDLDYIRDSMKKHNIDYFNQHCELQYKEIKEPDEWIILYTDNLKKKKTVCVLSCAVAKLKR